MGAAGAISVLASKTAGKEGEPSRPDKHVPGRGIEEAISERVMQTLFIDTHEHLVEEKERLGGPIMFDWLRHKADDWSLLLSHYLDSDMLTAGMPAADHEKFFSRTVNPADKWSLLAPYWPAIKNTGYGQAVRITVRELYGVDELSSETVRTVQRGYEKVCKPGFYTEILQKRARIESCQVNCLSRPFMESDMPTLLMQDLSILGMVDGPDSKQVSEPAGINVTCLSDWHRVMDWWFDKYGKYAVAVKSQDAYRRDIDYEKVPAEKAEKVFKKRLSNQELTTTETKLLKDHLFWYAVDKATEYDLPVKLHTGYYAGHNYMPLGRLMNNPSSATDLCRLAPETKFVFMHICYPYYEQLISVVKHYANAYVDMCWSWIINPLAAKDFLKKYLVTAPANKILTFGGDYIPVEPVLGHAAITRKGITQALTELAREGWLSKKSALEMVGPIMHDNACALFRLAQKTKILQKAKWS
jgi:predicted TIM-barrel fold metal-dependent hydrolase